MAHGIRVRSRHYLASGAVGGLIGFLLMEGATLLAPEIAAGEGHLFRSAFYFAGFGLALGAALGATEGVVFKRRSRLWYGLILGIVLGAVGGFGGGLAGQAIYSLVPLSYASPSQADIVIALDSSGSMKRWFFLGNDPRGLRKKAARKLVDRLSPNDRVAVVDFDLDAEVLFSLTPMALEKARRYAKDAIDRVDDEGGTNLDAGLEASLRILTEEKGDGRPKHVIFLTDGQGQYTPESFPQSFLDGVVIHTVGLGDDVEAPLLASIAERTGGAYYPVAKAKELISVFEQIFRERIAMTEVAEEGEELDLLTPGWVLILLRTLSWAVMGWVIGLGQGVRENTREDLRACSWGGLIGGALGGALFDPVSELVALGRGAIGRGLADVVVGAAIGGSMKLFQERMVESSVAPQRQLIGLLPEKATQGGRLKPMSLSGR